MSAICGTVNMDGKKVPLKVGKAMMDKFDIYRLDSKDVCFRGQVFFGCGIQYVTPESVLEKLPYTDIESKLTITADAIIDNRNELLELFNIAEDCKADITDSELILLAYKKWKCDCPKFLIGDFAFAIWDENKKELFCARDHVGKRTLYYYHSDKVFAFSTVINPLFVVTDEKPDLNERWITDFLALDGIPHEVECSDTIYKDIYQLPPATSIIVNMHEIKPNKYWNPLEDVKPLKLKSDKEYDEAFRKVFSEAIYCRLRCNHEIGIMLSGGLDSSSIACIAARKLAQEDRKLKAYASIPIKDYKNKLPKYYAANESEYIEAIKNCVNNIDITYCRSEGKDPLSNVDYFINILEQPYKIFRSIYWYEDIVDQAAESGCKVLLNGQSGNSTISFGDFFTHALTLYREKKMITLLKEIKSFSELVKASPYKVGKEVARIAFPYKLRKVIHKKKNKNLNRFSSVPINQNLIRKWNVEKRFDEKDINQIPEKYYDLYETHKQIVSATAFSHISTIETKISLAHGIVLRDPSRDKRVIEFCLSLPSEQFVRNGQERYLIRRSMEGIIPDKIRLNSAVRGFQSADWIQRLELRWEDVRFQLEQILEDANIQSYIDTPKLKKELTELKEPLEENRVEILLMFVTTLIFSKFIKAHNNHLILA